MIQILKETRLLFLVVITLDAVFWRSSSLLTGVSITLFLLLIGISIGAIPKRSAIILATIGFGVFVYKYIVLFKLSNPYENLTILILLNLIQIIIPVVSAGYILVYLNKKFTETDSRWLMIFMSISVKILAGIIITMNAFLIYLTIAHFAKGKY